MKFRKLLSLNCKVIQLKLFNFKLNLPLIFDNTPNLYCSICSGMNTASVTNIMLLENEKGSYKIIFFLNTVTIMLEKILQLTI